MPTTTTPAAGKLLADTLRTTFKVGNRTDLHTAMIEAVENAAQYPGYYSAEKTAILRAAWGAALSYRKHVQGYRIDGLLAQHINGLSAWQFAALLGRMAEAGVSNTGEGETFFTALAREIRA
jgi:hypothetical protein